MENLKKRISKAFGKNIFLLGEDEQEIKYWLEEPTFDCGWYWGFGYIETYTNNKNPKGAKDINTHEHASKFYPEFFLGRLVKTTFTEKEGWLLAELFRSFYLFRDLAEFYTYGNCHITESIFKPDSAKAKEINKEIIPKITAKIIEILSV
jgi:hypothetical protein